MKPPASFSWRRVAALVVILWLGLVWLRACGLLHWPWLALILPVVFVVVAFVVIGGVALLLLRCWLWLVYRAQTRRREREIREFKAAAQYGFANLIDRPLPRDEEAHRG